MCLASFFYIEIVEDRGVICSPKACRKCLFAALQGLNQSLLDSFQSIEFWVCFVCFLLFFFFFKAGRMFLANNKSVQKCSFEEATCRIKSNLVNRFSWERNRKHS